MPGSMDGLKLARAIRDRWPPQQDEIPERGRFFAKPYRDDEIINTLQEFASSGLVM
jgi:hypothetical protein